MNKFLSLWILAITIQTNVFGQVTGKINDETGRPLPNQMLYLNNGAQVQTGTAGEFAFNNLLPGSYHLSAQVKEQLIPLSTFKYEKGQNLQLGTLVLSRSIQLQEARITDKYVERHIERLPEVRDNIIYSGKKNEVVKLSTAAANLAQNNSRQIFAKVPGVQVWESDGSGVQMGIATRGLSPNRMWEFNTRQNGYDIAADPFGYPEAYFTPSVESLDRIEVIRGAASLQYGPQFGGVVNYIKKQSITGKKIGIESVQTTGSNGLFSSFNAIGGQVNKFSYYGNINFRHSDGWRQNNDYNTINGYLQLGYQFTRKLKLTIEYSQMHQMVHQPGGLTDSMFKVDPRMSIRNRNWFNLDWHIPAAVIDYQISKNQQLNIKVFGLSGYRSSIGNLAAINTADTPDSNGVYSQRRLDQDWYLNKGIEARYLLSYEMAGKKNYLAAGLRYYSGMTNRIRNNFADRGTSYATGVEKDIRALDQVFGTTNVAVFAEHLFRITSRWTVTPGFRFEHLYNSSKGQSSLAIANVDVNSTRNFTLLGIGSEYKFSGNISAYGNITQAYRPVQFSDLTPTSATDSIDQNLKDSKGYNADLGFRGTVSNWLSFDVSAYFLYYRDRIGVYAVGPMNYRTNIGASVSKGLEAYVEVSPTRLLENASFGQINIFITSSFNDSRYTSWNNPDPAKNQQGKKVENAPGQIHRIGLSYHYRKLSTTFQYSKVESAFADAMNISSPTANAQAGIIPAYEVTDWSFQLRLPKHLTLNGGINNVFNQYYFTRRGGGYPGPGLLPAEGRTWYIGLGIKL